MNGAEVIQSNHIKLFKQKTSKCYAITVSIVFNNCTVHQHYAQGGLQMVALNLAELLQALAELYSGCYLFVISRGSSVRI